MNLSDTTDITEQTFCLGYLYNIELQYIREDWGRQKTADNVYTIYGETEKTAAYYTLLTLFGSPQGVDRGGLFSFSRGLKPRVVGGFYLAHFALSLSL